MSSRFGLRFVATMTTVSLLAIAMIVNTGRAADAPPSTVSVLQGTLTFVASSGSVNDKRIYEIAVDSKSGTIFHRAWRSQ